MSLFWIHGGFLMVEIVLVVTLAIVLIEAGMLVVLLRRFRSHSDFARRFDDIGNLVAQVPGVLRTEFAESRKEGADGARRQREELTGSLEILRGTSRNGITELRNEMNSILKTIWNAIAKHLQQIQLTSASSSKETREELAKSIKSFSDDQSERMNAFSRRISELIERSEKQSEGLRTIVDTNLTKLREGNERKLDDMRKVVEDKLHDTLEKRLGDSFRQVSERLEQVHKGLGEMQSLANGVGDLKRVMTNIKTRGTWGEIQLGAILEQILTAEQYDRNVVTVPDSTERVEFAIKLPGDSSGQPVFLPIDAKFPSEDYQRLIEAQEACDIDAVNAATKQLELAIKACAKQICEKYISPPSTTDFGIMFLPTEGLYAETIRRTGLVEYCQRHCRVVIAGPTTFAAILNSLQMGFRTLAIQERSSEVWRVLGAVKTEFGKFSGAIEKIKKKLQEATNTIDKAETRTRVMSRQLRSVEALPAQDAIDLLGSSDDENTIDGEMEIESDSPKSVDATPQLIVRPR
jgi:DNA recombination protein RmuC